MTTKKTIPHCRYCKAKPVSPKWGNGFCSQAHAARFICARFADWYEWDEESSDWTTSGSQDSERHDDETDYDNE